MKICTHNSMVSMQQAGMGQQAALKAASIILKTEQNQGTQIAGMLQQASASQAKSMTQAQPLQPGGIDVLA